MVRALRRQLGQPIPFLPGLRSGGRRKGHQLSKDRKGWDYPEWTYPLKNFTLSLKN